MSGVIIRNFTGATSLHYHNGLPYDIDGALLVSQGMCIAQRNDGWVRTPENSANDAIYGVVASVTVPAGTMGTNSVLKITSVWSYGQLITKTFATDFGGATVGASTATTSDAFKIFTEIMNLNSLSVQKTHNTHTYGSAGAPLSGTVNTANDAVIDFKCKWSAAATEPITLVGYSIWHFPGS